MSKNLIIVCNKPMVYKENNKTYYDEYSYLADFSDYHNGPNWFNNIERRLFIGLKGKYKDSLIIFIGDDVSSNGVIKFKTIEEKKIYDEFLIEFNSSSKIIIFGHHYFQRDTDYIFSNCHLGFHYIKICSAILLATAQSSNINNIKIIVTCCSVASSDFLEKFYNYMHTFIPCVVSGYSSGILIFPGNKEQNLITSLYKLFTENNPTTINIRTIKNNKKDEYIKYGEDIFEKLKRLVSYETSSYDKKQLIKKSEDIQELCYIVSQRRKYGTGSTNTLKKIAYLLNMPQYLPIKSKMNFRDHEKVREIDIRSYAIFNQTYYALSEKYNVNEKKILDFFSSKYLKY